MANKKISQLTDGTSFQAGDEAVVNRSGVNYKVDPTQFGSSIDVTGTVTSDGLTLAAGSEIASDGGLVLNIDSDSSSGSTYFEINADSTNRPVARFVENGDISFYEDTGTTPKFFWDASEERLGIGTTSPANQLTLQSADPTIRLNETAGGFSIISGNGANLFFSADNDNAVGSTSIQFRVDGSEKMRIDSSGNLLVGKTAISTATVGHQLLASGLATFTRDGGDVAAYNRLTSDGDIAVFRKDGSTVGSIGSKNGDLDIGTGNTVIRFNDGLGSIFPVTAVSGGGNDAAVDIGYSTIRFKDLYLSGGVYLGGTGAANLLDDYEEGTWTPVVADSPSAGTSATGTFSGSYVKVGKLVTVQCTLKDIDTTGLGASNVVYVRGLPFTSSSSNDSTAQPRVQNVAYADSIAALYAESRTYLFFTSNTQGSSSASLIVSNLTSGTADISFNLSYEAA